MRRWLGVLCSLGLLVSISMGQSGDTELIVTLKDGQSIKALSAGTGTVVKRKVANAPIYLLSVPGQDSNGALAEIRRSAIVDLAEQNRPFKLTSTDIPVSQYASLAHALSDLLDGNARTTFYGVSVLQAYAQQPALDVVRASAVRSISTGVGSRVAYIDTGVDPYHPALQPWLEPGVDLVGGTSTSEMDGFDHAMSDLLDHAMSDLLDKHFFFMLNSSADPALPALGHGTMVAGLIHAVAPEARIFPIKAFDPYGNTTLFSIVDGVYRAIDARADVLNMSFSTEIDSFTFHRALDAAKASGIGLTAAVGNEGQETRDLYPAAYTSVLGVAATDNNDKIAEFSNYGSTVKVTAPGALVISTAPGGRYAIASGTSFSSPIVAGAIAVVASKWGHGLVDQSMVVTTADSMDTVNPGFERKLGRGRINLQEALKVAGR